MVDNSEKQSIKYTNSKSDIWKAYKDAVALLEKPSTSVLEQTSAVKQISTNNKKLSNQLIVLKTHIIDQLDSEISDIVEQFENARKTLIVVCQTAENIQQDQEEQKAKITQERDRQEEEYSYDFNKRKNRQEEELKEMRQKVESDLKQQKDEVKKQQDELIELRKQASEFEKRLELETNKVAVTTEKKLKESYAHEQALAKSENRNALALLEQKVAALQEVVKSQQDEIKRLQGSIDSANKQVTSIAEKAVSRSNQPTVSQSSVNPKD